MKKFDVKTEIKMLKAIDRILEQQEDNLPEEQADKLAQEDKLVLMSPDNVVGVIPLSEECVSLLLRYTNSGGVLSVPKLDYSNDDKTIAKAKFCSEYLKRIFDVFDCFENESVLITLKYDYPIKVENKHIRIYLAPRVEDD